MKSSHSNAQNPRGQVNFSLHYLSGKETGKVLELEEGREYKVGRGRTYEIRIDANDEEASRFHASLFQADANLMLEDKSANGTFVNGERVQKVALADGDHIRMGHAGFKVVAKIKVSSGAQDWWDQTHATIGTATFTPTPSGGTAKWLSGSLQEIGLMDLLQLLSNSQKSGVLVLKRRGDEGMLYLHDGQITSASLNGRTAIQPIKTLYRLLRWKRGRFEMTPPADLPTSVPEITGSTPSLLLDGAQLADEFSDLEDKLPAASARLTVVRPLPERLRDLGPEELDLVQLILEHDSWIEVLDHHSGTDLEASLQLLELTRKGIIRVVSSHDCLPHPAEPEGLPSNNR